jgi:hypothetical protein
MMSRGFAFTKRRTAGALAVVALAVPAAVAWAAPPAPPKCNGVTQQVRSAPNKSQTWKNWRSPKYYGTRTQWTFDYVYTWTEGTTTQTGTCTA